MNIRKILAGSLAAVMTGATMGIGVFGAADLGTYPAPFVDGTQKDFILALGSGAAVPDVVGANAQLSALEVALADARVAAAGTGTAPKVSFGEGKTEHVAPGSDLRNSIEKQRAGSNGTTESQFFVLVPKGEAGGYGVSFLNKGEILKSGTTYKWREVVNDTLTTDTDVAPETSASDSKANFEKLTLLKVSGTSTRTTGLAYYLEFSERNISAANLEGKEVAWLGEKHVVIDVNSDGTKIQLGKTGAKHSGVVSGTEITVGAKAVKVTNVDITNNRVSVQVGTDTATVDQGDIVTVGGVKVAVVSGTVGEVYGSGGSKTGSADLIVGEASEILELKNGAKYEGDWYVFIDTQANPQAIRRVGLYNIKSYTGTTSLKLGDSIKLPGGLAHLKFGPSPAGLSATSSGLETMGTTGYYDLTFTQEQIDGGINTFGDGVVDTYATKITATDQDGKAAKIFTVSGIDSMAGGGSKDTDKFWVTVFGTVASSRAMYFVENETDSSKLGNSSTSPTLVGLDNSGWAINALNNSDTSTATGTVTALPEYKVDITLPQSQDNNVNNISIHANTSRFNASTAGRSAAALGYGGTADSDSFAYAWMVGTGNLRTVSYGTWWLARTGTTSYARVGSANSYGATAEELSTSTIKIRVPKSRAGVPVFLGKEAAEHASARTPVAKLDTELTAADKTANNVISVGGPCVNKVTAELMGKTFPACGADSGIPEGKGWIKLYENAFNGGKVALVVAGWEAEDTRRATDILADGPSVHSELTGTEAEV